LEPDINKLPSAKLTRQDKGQDPEAADPKLPITILQFFKLLSSIVLG
jgi:hypothetical protein